MLLDKNSIENEIANVRDSILSGVQIGEANSKLDEELISSLDNILKIVSNPETEYTQRLEAIASLQGLLLKPLMKELTAKMPNENRIKAAEKTASALSNLLKTLDTKKKSEIKDEIDPTSPKFQIAFQLFIEVIHATLQEQGAEDLFISSFFDSFSNKLMGWEDVLVKSMKGAAMKSLERKHIENPFLQAFKSKTRVQKDVE